MKVKLEYIWLDGSKVQLLRSKTKIKEFKGINVNKLLDTKDFHKYISDWNYDGSSTGQADCDNSDIILRPVNIFRNPLDEDSILVMCETLNSDETPHETNNRRKMIESLKNDDNTWYGYEQEYVIYNNDTMRPLGWPKDPNSFPKPQGDYYCGVGANHVSGREFVNKHRDLCLKAGLNISGINAEVMLGQWEYQIGPVSAADGADQLWISRYLLYRLGESYNYSINIDPKPFKGEEWNGSGMHVNFSTEKLRKDLKNKSKIAIKYCEKLEKKHKEHILVYGDGNKDRLIGANEAATMTDFTWGFKDRSASIRIPSTINDKHTPGYIEDRRPASNADPYILVKRIVDTILN